eukprot:3741185-Alexandrium_andersonii.AAC.1
MSQPLRFARGLRFGSGACASPMPTSTCWAGRVPSRERVARIASGCATRSSGVRLRIRRLLAIALGCD